MRRLCLVAMLLVGATSSGAHGYALGLQLPKEAVSFWHLGEKSTWGIELAYDIRWTKDVDAESVTDIFERRMEETRRHERWIELAFINQRTPWKTEGDVVPFWFARLGGRMAITRLGEYEAFEDPIPLTEMTAWNIGFTVGAGVCWKPFDRVALWLRQGLEMSYKKIDVINKKDQLGTYQDFLGATLSTPVAMAVFMW